MQIGHFLVEFLFPRHHPTIPDLYARDQRFAATSDKEQILDYPYK